MSPSALTEARDHVPELDWLKGFAIICVICIHAKLYGDTLFHDRIINRAVPIFVVLFGATSELWWKRASAQPGESPARKWYGSRLRRLVIPFWAMAALWWLAIVASGNTRAVGVTWREAAVTFLGFAPWIGTTWFVTIILQLVLLYPGLRWVTGRVGLAVSLLVSALLCVGSFWYFFEIMQAGFDWFGRAFVGPGFYYFWIFSPRMFFHVIAGIALARWIGARPGPKLTVGALAVAVAGSFVQDYAQGPPGDMFGPLRGQAVAYLVDAPLTVGLLGLFRWVPLPELVRRALGWCGVFSWGIYLGHLLVHELIHRAGYSPIIGTEAERALYAALLLTSGAALAAAADWLWKRLPPKNLDLASS